tara:strand:- start:1426 stop:2448 length:1023 start_codon:yes stop_codon:yes gene_type:complete
LKGHELLAIIIAICSVNNARATTLQFWGDFFISDRAMNQTKANIDPSNMLAEIFPITRGADYNIVNMEGVITKNQVPWLKKEFNLHMPVGTISIMKSLGINIASLANNHSLDFGLIGLIETQSQLKSAGIKFGGAGFNLEDAIKPVVIDTQEGRVCILMLTRTLPKEFWASDYEEGTSYISFSRTRKLIKQLKSSYDWVFPYIHWGKEGRIEPKAYQVKLAQLMIDAGADAVIGHHPHIIQNIEVYKGKPIFYSIGNFIFNTKPPSTPEGMGVKIRISRNKPLQATIFGLDVNNWKTEFKPKILPFSEYERLLKDRAKSLLQYCQKAFIGKLKVLQCDFK